MRPDLDEYYQIDQYLDNKLQGEELHAFEKRMSLDDSFAKQVQEQRMLNNFILEAELKSVRQQIETDLIKFNSPSFFRTHWKWIGVSMLGILGLVFYTFNTKKQNTKALIEAEQKADQTKQRSNLSQQPNTINATSSAEALKSKTTATNSSGTIIEPATKTIDTLHLIETVEIPVQQKATVINSVSTTVIDTKETTEIKKSDCSTVKISFTLKPLPTCKDEEAGSIYIENISGGIAPYTFLLDNNKVKEKKIRALGAGTYEIKITDKNGCSSEQKTIVTEKNCATPVYQETKFNINPGIGEVCKIPFNPNKTGNFTIYNRSGKIIFRVTSNTNEFIEWNGTDGYGSLVDQGLYVYIIEYTDGTKVTGEVNIIR